MSIGAPARHALVFQMVGPADLANAVGLNSSLGTTARVVGPAIGGAIVALGGRRRRVRNQRDHLPRRGRRTAPDRRVEAPHAAELPRRDAGRRRASTRCASSSTTRARASRSSPCSCSRRSRSTSTCALPAARRADARRRRRDLRSDRRGLRRGRAHRRTCDGETRYEQRRERRHLTELGHRLERQLERRRLDRACQQPIDVDSSTAKSSASPSAAEQSRSSVRIRAARAPRTSRRR